MATLLVRSGRHSPDALREAARAEQSLPVVLTMLGDLGDREDEKMLSHLVSHHDAKYLKKVLSTRELRSAGRRGS